MSQTCEQVKRFSLEDFEPYRGYYFLDIGDANIMIFFNGLCHCWFWIVSRPMSTLASHTSYCTAEEAVDNLNFVIGEQEGEE